MSAAGKNILVGVTGGIAAYKIPNLVRLLVKSGASVRVMMTKGATKFVTPLTLETVSTQPVIADMWEGDFVSTRHIDWAEWPDLIVIAPATANLLGKVAAGISDDFVSTVLCATKKPVIIAPAMNPAMWQNQTTQRNLQYMLELGYTIVDPEEGEMACDSVGVGRMAEPEAIFERVTAFFAANSKKKVLSGKRIVVTAGPTREAIDPVRFLSNRSSGKMGYAIATAAAKAGAKTTLISGHSSVSAPNGVETIEVESTGELLSELKRQFEHADCLIMAAAPADYVPKEVALHKIKKSGRPMTLELIPAPDILKTLPRSKTGRQIIVGFALETEHAIENGKKKLADKSLDLIVVNSLADAGAGFQHDTNKLTLLFADGRRVDWPLMTKVAAGERLVNEVIAPML